MTRRIQSSISAWLSEGTGGVRVEIGLRDFPIVAGYSFAMSFGEELDGFRVGDVCGLEHRDLEPGPVVVELLHRGSGDRLDDPMDVARNGVSVRGACGSRVAA